MEDLQMNNLTGIEKKIYDYFFGIAALVIAGEMIFFRVEKMPIQAEICKAIGVASPKTYRSYLEKMVSEGILELDEQKRVIIECPLKIDKKVISFINNAFNKDAIKIYVCLGIKWQECKETGDECKFSVKALAAYFGFTEEKVQDILRVLMQNYFLKLVFTLNSDELVLLNFGGGLYVPVWN